jgi:hypothetical protein
MLDPERLHNSTHDNFARQARRGTHNRRGRAASTGIAPAVFRKDLRFIASNLGRKHRSYLGYQSQTRAGTTPPRRLGGNVNCESVVRVSELGADRKPIWDGGIEQGPSRTPSKSISTGLTFP